MDVSVIIPVYNGERTISRCLDSVFAQEGCSFEVIVVNDGSTDGTQDLLESYKKTVGDVLKIVCQDNRGAAAARNSGISIAAGRYISFLDADDEFLPGRLFTYVKYIETRPSVGVVYSEPLVIRDGLTFPFYKGRQMPQGDIFKYLSMRLFIILSTVMCRTSCLKRVGGFDDQFTILEDYDLFLRLAYVCEFGYIDKCLTRFNISSNSLSLGGQHRSGPYFRRVLLRKNKQLINERFLFPRLVFRKLYADTYYDEGVNASKSGDRKEEKLLYLRSFMMYPLSPKPLRALLLALMGRHR